MKTICLIAGGLTLVASPADGREPIREQRIARVVETEGLIAFWDFHHQEDGRWTSHHDPKVLGRGYPVVLRRIGDPQSYTPEQWPYNDDVSELHYDGFGPFGRAVRMNKGLMDGVAVFNRALSEKELKALSFCGS